MLELRAVILTLTVSLFCLFLPAAEAQRAGQQMQVSMTLSHVVVAANGKQLLLTADGRAIALPGQGVKGNQVAVYHGSHGGTWYVDQTGRQVEIPGFNPGSGSPAAMTISSAIGESAGAVRYGMPVYYGGDGAFYYGDGGRRTAVDEDDVVNREHFNQWRDQRSWYGNQFNEGGRWYRRYWAGQERGFPSPWEGARDEHREHHEGEHRDRDRHEEHHEHREHHEHHGEHHEHHGGGHHRR